MIAKMHLSICAAVKGFEGFYAVSVDGAVHSLGRPRRGAKPGQHATTPRTLKPVHNRDGYELVNLVDALGRMHQRSVHRVVAGAFCAQPPGASQVNHIDGHKTNNSAKNLEWVTLQENVAHAKSMGLMTGGGRCKLSGSEARAVRAMIKGGAVYADACERFGCGMSTVSRIVNGKGRYEMKEG